MDSLSISRFHHCDKCQGALCSQTAALMCPLRQDPTQGQLVSERLRKVPGSSVSPRLLTAFICRGQDSGTCSWVSAVSNNFPRSFQNVSEFRWELGSVEKNQEGKKWGWSIYSLLKMIQPCHEMPAHFSPTHGTYFLWIMPTLTSWNLELLLVLFTWTFPL